MASDETKDDLFTLPLHVRRDSVYHRLYDSEDRLVCFIGITDKSELQAEAICNAANVYSPAREAAISRLVTALQELLNFGVESDDPRLDYIMAHVDRDAVRVAREALAEWEASK